MKKTTRRAPRGLALLMVRVGCLAVAGISAVGLFVVVPGATATGATSSAVTVGWVAASGTTNSDQPVRDTGNAEYDGFKNLQVSVAQTEDIGDQAVRVSITGFTGTRGAIDAGGTQYTDAMNFMQAMQCWGPDPSAANFNQTCQWGGRFVDNNGLGNSVYPDNTLRVALRDVAPETKNAVDVPFLPAPAAGNSTVGITSVTGRQAFKLDAGNKPTKTVTYPLLDYTNPATTNEVQSARINRDGTGVFDFETQSAEQAPQLGCGSAGHLRCWLVLVPRGTKYGGHDDSCSGLVDNNGVAYTFGRAQSIQGGSPINPACSYWNNRMTIPLDFTPVGSTCAPDNTQRRVIGSQLLIAAMASWQPALCSKLSTTYSFAANPDSVARLQLIENQAGLAFGSFPVVAGELDNDADKAKLKTTTLSTAPVAIGSTVVAYVAEGSDGRLNSLNLSPRLMAKLLTQSYEFTVPWNSSEPQKNFAHLPTANQKILYFNQDPEFRELNPNWAQFTTNPALMLPGPAGADAIRQLWRWILADSEAKTWIDGTPDKAGISVNPFYLPAGNINAQVPEFLPSGDYKMVDGKQVYRQVGLKHIDGTPEKLSETLLDTFPKADESLVPLTLNVEKYRFGTLQYGPYSDSFNNAARSAFRADPNSKTVWDPAKVNAAGDVGDWVSSGAQSPGQKFVIAVTDAASASRYSLNTAALRLDNSTTSFVKADTAGMTAALSGLTATADPAVKQIDPAQVTGSGYPLTTVVYATVNLSASDKPALADYAAFIKQITVSGQVAGTAVGQLPIGYIPLTSAMATQAASAAAAISAYQPTVDPAAQQPSEATTSATQSGATTGYAQDDYSPATSKVAGSSTALPAVPSAGGAGNTAVITALTTDTPKPTPAAPDAFWGQSSLALSLGGGLSGAIFAPLLFRGRRFS
ncbi:MAG: hypothetical protein H7248_09970 [Microbacteriaceae bacterium]|nr:hypothetical protein [Microbacteriaceae bacterium]